MADLLKLLLKIRAREIDVAPRLLTRADEMEALAAGVRDLKVLKGWRYEVFGQRCAGTGRRADWPFAVQNGPSSPWRISTTCNQAWKNALAAE